MLKKEVGAIFAALLLVATLGAGVASAEAVIIGGEYNDTGVDTSSFIFSEFFTTDLWNGSFWDYLVEGEAAEAVKEARDARDMNETAEAVEKARDARDMNETAEAEESTPFWLSGDKTSRPAGYWDVNLSAGKTPRPAGYWDVNPDFYKRGFSWYNISGYWDVNWSILQP